MKLLTVAICDDEKNIAMTLAGALEKIFEQYDTRIETEMFSSADAFARRLREKHFDTVFLDIDMPGTDGISFGKKLREENLSPELLILSGRHAPALSMAKHLYHSYFSSNLRCVPQGSSLQSKGSCRLWPRW